MLGEALELNEKALGHLEDFFKRLNRVMPVSNKIQAMIPRGVRVLHNPAGTAAGMDADYQSADKKTNCRIFVMPGVPKEMKKMFGESILPLLKTEAGDSVILSKTLHTFGLGESSVAEKLGDLMARTRNPSVGTTVAGGIVSLRLNARFPSRVQGEKELAATEQSCSCGTLGEIIFGAANDDTLQSVVAVLLNRKSESQKPKSVTTAESCTGGLLAKMLTDIAGSSSYFAQGVGCLCKCCQT